MKSYLALLAVLVASTSFAWNAPGGVLVTGHIAWIQVSTTGAIHFVLVGAPPLCVSGGTGNNAIGEILPGQSTSGGVNTTEGMRAFLSSLTAAKLAGKPVKVYADNNGAVGCKVGAIDFDP